MSAGMPAGPSQRRRRTRPRAERATAPRGRPPRGRSRTGAPGRSTPSRVPDESRAPRAIPPGRRPPSLLSPYPAAAAPGLQEVDGEEDHEGRRQHDGAERRGSPVIKLLQMNDDEEGSDLGLQGRVARDEDDRAVF